MTTRAPVLTMAHSPAHRALQRGLTLIELMVAMAIGLVVMATMLKVYVDSSRLYRFSTGLSRIQENGRFGLEFIRQDARLAGFWGCYHDITLSNRISTTNSNCRPYTGTGTVCTNSPGKGNNIGGTNNNPATAPLVATSDTITFRGATGAAMSLSGDVGTSGAVGVTSTGSIQTGDTVLISNCEVGDIFEVTATGAGTLTHGAGSNTTADLLNSYEQAASSVYLVQEHTYCVAAGVDGTTPALRRLTFPNGLGAAATCAANGDEMVEGVEDMQILYGEDTDADNVANRYVAAGTAALAMENVVSVRISLLLRSVENNLTTAPAPYTYMGTTTTPPAGDLYLRKVFNATISVRNGD